MIAELDTCLKCGKELPCAKRPGTRVVCIECCKAQWERRVLRIVVPGPSVSINRTYKVNYKTGSFYKSEAVKDYQKRIYSIAYAEVLRTRWPHRDDPVQVSIWMMNMRTDIDAGAKATLDALEGVVYSNDKQVHRLLVERGKDREGARLVVEVQPWCS